MAAGLLLGGSVAALADAIMMGSGELRGWSVMVAGEKACDNPFSDENQKTISCDNR